MKKHILFVLTLFGALFPRAEGRTLSDRQRHCIEVNIFLHGICNIESHFNIPALINFLKDTIYDTYYHYNINVFRKDPYFYQFQAMQDTGLHEITDHTVRPGNTCGALTMIIDRTFSLIAPQRAPLQRYYTYGWSGLHSIKEYRAAGKEFYEVIQALKKDLAQQGYKSFIRIWGYSHGGNVSLMMAHQHGSEPDDTIDELILLGTPFLTGATVELVESPLFKKVYNVYSLSDKVQQYDVIHPQAIRCEQKLTKKSLKTMPSNLVQVRLKYTIPSRHAQKREKSFAHSQDFGRKSIITGKSSLLRNVSPGHLELWMFGWTFDHYRSDYVTYPIPAAALSIPYIIESVNALDQSFHNPQEEFIVDVRPLHGVVLINQKTKKQGTVCRALVPFFDKEIFEDLKATVLLYNPLDLTYENYVQYLARVDQKTVELFTARMQLT